MPNASSIDTTPLQRLLQGRGWLVGCAALAVALSLQALGAGWEIDDLIHRHYLLQGEKPVWDLFGFLDGSPEVTTALRSTGQVPWWTLPDLQVNFFRPIASLTMWIDYRLWPDSAAAMHAHSLAWLAACVVVAGLLYRRLMGGGVVAGLGLLLFAIDDAHALPAMWLANRNVLPAFLFGGVALLLHDAGWQGAWRPGRVLAPLALAASLFSAEAGAAAAAYLFAHVLVYRRGLWQRVQPLIGYAVVVVLWRGVYSGLGYGTYGSGFYIDPGSEPGRFVAALFEYAPILMLMQWMLPINIDGWVAMFGPTPAGAAVAAGIVVCVALVVWPLLRDDRSSRFWALGMILALPPVCATVPMARLLLFVGLGGAALVARFLTVSRAHLAPGRRRLAGCLAVWFILVHGLAAPIGLARQTRQLMPPDVAAQVMIQMPMAPAAEHQTLIVLNAPSVFHASHLPLLQAAAGHPVPGGLRFLSPSWCAVTVQRPDARTLVVRPEGGYCRRPLDELFRGGHHAFALGTRVDLGVLSVAVTAVTADGRAAEITARFDAPLEDDSLAWVDWRDGRFRWAHPPAIGTSVTIPAPVLPGIGD